LTNNNTDREPRRLDFTVEYKNLNEETGYVEAIMQPNTRRYHEVNHKDELHLLDIYTKELIPKKSFFEQMSNSTHGLPIYQLSPNIESTKQYAANRNEALKNEFKSGKYIAPSENAMKHLEVSDFSGEKWIGFLAIDIVGSTKLSVEYNEKYAKAYKIFMREIGTLFGMFNASIFKHTGDGFIAYMDHPSFTRIADNLVDLGCSIIQILFEGINPILVKNNLPKLSVRVGAECGFSKINQVIIPETGFKSIDIMSDAINRSVKIESSSEVNGFAIGQALYRTLHIDWLERCTQIEFDSKKVGLKKYNVYKLT